MSTLPNYKGGIDLISGIRPKNGGDFPLAEAHDILVGENDKRLDTELKEIKQSIASGGGGSGGTTFTTDETLSLSNGVLKVNTTNEITPDNNLPITAAAVYNTVGNINTILTSI